MELIDQHTKTIMEGCKERARDAGLRFDDETLEYIVTNRDLVELGPKNMIPTLYDYWVHDVEVLKGRGRYELYPHNPYETVINTRPAISFYNDNNPDWLNVMIFYHVLAHIDFFQNNVCFQHTWDMDFGGQALSDKRMIAKLRAERGRWVDYVIEFARSIDNIVSYHDTLYRLPGEETPALTPRLDYYFDVFLQQEKTVSVSEYIDEIERYNRCVQTHGDLGEKRFFSRAEERYPEFAAFYAKHRSTARPRSSDLLQYLVHHSMKLNRMENHWMKAVLEMIRNTSLVFQPQIRTKIMNEGWASYWHETLFLRDERIRGHEVDFARVNASVTSLPRVGMNPYALGMRLFYQIEDMADRGGYSLEYHRLHDAVLRDRFDRMTGAGRDFIFFVRRHYNDFHFIRDFLDQAFVDRYRLFVADKTLDKQRMVWQYIVRSRKAEDYRRMVIDSLYHPPHIVIDEEKSDGGNLYLNHRFEEKPLVSEFIANTMLGIEYLWGGPVLLETSEVKSISKAEHGTKSGASTGDEEPVTVVWQRVLYTMKDRKLTRKVIA